MTSFQRTWVVLGTVVVSACVGVFAWWALRPVVRDARLERALRDIGLSIIREEMYRESENGLVLASGISLSDPEFGGIRCLEGPIEEMFVLAPSGSDGKPIEVGPDARPPRIIAWSSGVYEGKRVLLLSNFMVTWEPEHEIDWEGRTVLLNTDADAATD